MSEENNTVRAKPTRGARPTGPRAHRIRRIVLGVAGLVALALLVSAIGYMWWFSALVDELADGENLEDYGEWLRGLHAVDQ